jgi:hypothetical protein
MLVVDRASFAAGEPYPGSMVASRPLRQFRFLASVTVEQSEERHLHDDLGPGPPEGIVRFSYP